MVTLTTGRSEVGMQVPQILANTIFGRQYKGQRKHWRNDTPLIVVPQGDEDAYPSFAAL
jgi:hypothetical protein